MVYLDSKIASVFFYQTTRDLIRKRMWSIWLRINFTLPFLHSTVGVVGTS